MTRLTIFLFFFTLSTMAQQVQDTLGKVKTPEEGVETKIAFENSCHYVVQNPLLIIDGKRYKTKKSYKKIKIDMTGNAQSLNVATAGAILIYEMCK